MQLLSQSFWCQKVSSTLTFHTTNIVKIPNSISMFLFHRVMQHTGVSGILTWTDVIFITIIIRRRKKKPLSGISTATVPKI